MQATGAATLSLALVALGRWPAFAAATVLWGAVVAVMGSLALLALYRGLALGPVAVVSPISAGYAAVTVLLLVVLAGEPVTAPELVAIGMTIAGVLLASTDLRVVRALAGRPLPGVGWALAAMVGFGCWGAAVAVASRAHDQLALVVMGRVVGTVVLLLVVLAARRAPPADRRPSTLAMVALVGITDTLANVSFVLGLAAGQAAIVATLGALYPVVTAVLAIVFLGERLAPNQYAGVVMLLAGVAGLGLLR